MIEIESIDRVIFLPSYNLLTTWYVYITESRKKNVRCPEKYSPNSSAKNYQACVVSYWWPAAATAMKQTTWQQEALMKAYMASRSFDNEAGFSAWLYRIACNTLIDHQRKQTTLILDEITGAYCLPRCWKHIIQIKNHKEILIPGGHKPNKDGWID